MVSILSFQVAQAQSGGYPLVCRSGGGMKLSWSALFNARTNLIAYFDRAPNAAGANASATWACLIYCADYRSSNSIAISGDSWPDDARLSDIEERFACQACGKRGADVQPDFNWNGQPRGLIGRHSWIKQN